MNVPEFDILAKSFNENNFRLFMIGGTSRDFLLGEEIYDFDFVTDATPEEMKKFLPELDTTFAKYGSCKIKINNKKIDLTTLREEGKYNDSRHPSYIKFVKDINLDYKRRDFTINAIYIDESYNVIDPSNGLIDLKNKLIRMIGDPYLRIKEDPLRIIRAERFSKIYGFTIDKNLEEVINSNRDLLNELNEEKILEENRKLEKSLERKKYETISSSRRL